MEPMWGYAEFKRWLEANADTLKGRSLEEIADLAIACGHSRVIVKQWQARERFKAVQP